MKRNGLNLRKAGMADSRMIGEQNGVWKNSRQTASTHNEEEWFGFV